MSCNCTDCTCDSPIGLEMDKQNLFDYIESCGLSIAEIKEVIGDYDSFYYRERKRPDYIQEAKDAASLSCYDDI